MFIALNRGTADSSPEPAGITSWSSPMVSSPCFIIHWHVMVCLTLLGTQTKPQFDA